mgnify:CR=1 FL=1
MKRKLRIFLTVILCMTLVLQAVLPVWGFDETNEVFSGAEINLSENWSDGDALDSDEIPGESESKPEDIEVEEGEISIDSSESAEENPQTDEDDNIFVEEEADIPEASQTQGLSITNEDEIFSDGAAVFTDEDASVRDTVLVLDCSGSMSGTPLTTMQQAAVKFCKQLTVSKGRIAVLSFSSSVTMLTDFTRDEALLEEKITGISAGGGTNTTAAMEKAYEILMNSTASARNIVLMTDGLAENGKTSSDGPYTDVYANALYNTVMPMQKNCNIYTMGFFHRLSASEKSIAEKVLEDIQNSGYYDVKNAEDINFAFDDVADDINNINQEKEKAFIQKHKEFLQQLDYAKFMQEQNAASRVLKIYGSSFEGFAAWKLVTGGLSDNPYNVVLADLILSEEYAAAQLESLESSYLLELPSVAGTIITLIDGSVDLDADTRNAIQKFLCMDDKSDTNTYKLLEDIFKNKISQENLNKALNAITDAETVATFLKRGQSIVDSVVDIINYSAVVNAYTNTSDEFKIILVLTDYYGNSKMMQAALQDFYDISSDEKANEKIRERILSEGVDQALGICSDIFKDSLVGTVKNYLYKTLDLSTAGVALASKATAFIEGCKIGYDVGTAFCNSFLNLDKASDAYFIAYASAYFTDSMECVLKTYIRDFQKEESLQSARTFCQAFRMYKHAQMKCVDRTLEYVSALATAKVANYNDYVAEMYNWLTYKAYWDGLVCDDPGSINLYYKSYKKTFIKIACPTDIRIATVDGIVMADISDDQITELGNDVQAVVINHKKYIFLPSDEKCQIAIKASGEGTMEYAVSKLSKDNKTISAVYSSDITLTEGQVFQGSLSPVNTAADDGILKTDGKIVPAETQIMEGDFLKKITLNHKNLTLKKGKNVKLKVTFSPEQCKETLTWKSENPKVVTVDKNGTLKVVSYGKTRIQVTSKSGLKAFCKITVSKVKAQKTQLDRKNITLYKNKSCKLKLSVKPNSFTEKVVWKSSNAKVAAVSSDGTVMAKGRGKAVITVTVGKTKASCKVTVKSLPVNSLKLNKSKITLDKGKSYTIKAYLSPKKTTEKVSWKSSDKKVVSVNKSGKVTGLKKGKATITAACGVKKKSCQVTVNDTSIKKISFSDENIILNVGTDRQLKVSVTPNNTKEKLVWKSSDKTVATVDQNGNVIGKRYGNVTIYASSPSGVSAFCHVRVIVPPQKLNLEKTNLTLPEGIRYHLSVSTQPVYADASDLVWNSSDNTVASVNRSGYIRARKAGTAVITVSAGKNIHAECAVTVVEKMNSGDVTPTVTPTVVPEEEYLIKTDKTGYSCKSGDKLIVKGTVKVKDNLIKGQNKYILYSAYLQNGWQENGGFNIDGRTYFEERWECEAKIKEYQVKGNQAEFTLEIPTSGISTGNKIFTLSIFPYDKYSTGNSLYDCMFTVTIN